MGEWNYIACTMTKEGHLSLGLKENLQVTAIDSQSQDDNNEEFPGEEIESK